MEKLQGNSMASGPITFLTFLRGMGWGLLAGLAGTVAMDLALLASLPALGVPADTCYLTIGSTVRHFFALLGITLAGDVTLGVAAYHLIGPLLGALYGLVVSQVGALQRTTLKNNMICAVLYAEMLSQLILTMTPVLLKMPAQETMIWFAGSFVVQMIWGMVMGLVTYYGWQLLTPGYRNRQADKSGGLLWIVKR